MNIRLTNIRAEKAMAAYKINGMKPLDELKIRMLCALEAIIYFAKALREHANVRRDPGRSFYKDLRNIYAKQVDILVDCILDPKKHLFKYTDYLLREQAIRNQNELVKFFPG